MSAAAKPFIVPAGYRVLEGRLDTHNRAVEIAGPDGDYVTAVQVIQFGRKPPSGTKARSGAGVTTIVLPAGAVVDTQSGLAHAYAVRRAPGGGAAYFAAAERGAVLAKMGRFDVLEEISTVRKLLNNTLTDERIEAARRALAEARLAGKLGEREKALEALADAETLVSAIPDDDEALIRALRRWKKSSGRGQARTGGR